VRRRPVLGFALLCLVCVAGAVGYVVFSERQNDALTTRGGSPATTVDAASLAQLEQSPWVLYRSTEVNADFGRVAVAPVDDLTHPLYTPLSCDRVAYDAGRGLCLITNQGAITTYQAVIFDQHFRRLFTIGLVGLPSRARISHDGRYGATTTFVYGDSYAGTSYSTRTQLYDLRSGKVLGDLEQFTTTKDGKAIDTVDRNLWGVTFDPTNSDRFYATESTGGTYYLVRGDISRRRMVVLRPGVECPSISPDGTRIAFKKRHIGPLGRVEWQLSVLDLSTLVDHPLAETRSVDDQVEWLDNSTVLYALPRSTSGTPADDTWAVAADGTGTPRRFVPGAYSTIVVRPPNT
jgi:hypothetical protein